MHSLLHRRTLTPSPEPHTALYIHTTYYQVCRLGHRHPSRIVSAHIQVSTILPVCCPVLIEPSPCPTGLAGHNVPSSLDAYVSAWDGA